MVRRVSHCIGSSFDFYPLVTLNKQKGDKKGVFDRVYSCSKRKTNFTIILSFVIPSGAERSREPALSMSKGMP